MTTDSASARSTDLLAFKEAMVNLFRDWAMHLSPSEVTLVGWLISNTIARGRVSGNYTLDQMVNGQAKADGSGMWTNGSGLSRPTAHRTIQALIDKGIVKSTRTGRGLDLSVNLFWRPTPVEKPETNIVAFPSSGNRRPPKKPSLAHQIMSETDDADVGFNQDRDQIDHEPVVKMITQNDQIDHTTKDLNQGQNNKGCASPSAHATRSASEVISEGLSKARPVPATPASGRITTIMLEQAWRSAYREAFPTVQPVAWTAKQHHIIRSVMKKYDPAQFRDFLVWLVHNWSHAVNTYCGWMKRDKPTSPSVPFFAKHHEALHQAWVDRAQHEYRGTLPQAEQQIAALMAKGLSRKAAELEVAKAAAIAEDRKQRERDLAAAASVLATAKAIERGAQAKMQQDAVLIGKLAKQVKEKTKTQNVGNYDPDKGVELEELPVIDLEKFAQ